MQIYSDHFGRVIWLTISPAEVRMDLQDLGPGMKTKKLHLILFFLKS